MQYALASVRSDDPEIRGHDRLVLRQHVGKALLKTQQIVRMKPRLEEVGARLMGGGVDPEYLIDLRRPADLAGHKVVFPTAKAS
jgi:hypothetical protein